MIEETGVVVELKGKHTVLVMCTKSSLCENCASNGNCTLGEDNRTRLIEVGNPVGAMVGDQVRISTSTQSFLTSSFLLYIVPLIALVVGAIAGKLVGENMATGLDPNVLSAIFGVFFMIGSFIILRVGSQALNNEDYRPNITEILKKEL